MSDPIPAALALLQQSRAKLDEAIAALTDPWQGVDRSGLTDVTVAVQKAIDEGRPVPAGRYLIDAVTGLRASRNVTLDPNAILIAKPNNAPRYCVLRLVGGDITLTGGQIIGDRSAHTYAAGSTHEWGYGVRVEGDGCEVDRTIVNRCTGDGFGIMGEDCTLRNVVSTYNRRQGLSGFNCGGLRIFDSEFSYTGPLGTDPGAPNGPCAGLDFEPDQAADVDVEIYRCRIIGNRAGVLGWLRSEVGGRLAIVVTDCDISANANGVETKALAGAITLNALRNKLAKNTGAAFKVGAGSVQNIGNAIAADANIITGMAARAAMTKSGIVTKYDIQVADGGVANVGMNTYQ